MLSQILQHHSSKCFFVALFLLLINVNIIDVSYAGGRASVRVDSESTDYPFNTVQRVQKVLKELGYNPGPVDGIWGPLTRDAIIDYQQNNALSETGKLNLETKQLLLTNN